MPLLHKHFPETFLGSHNSPPFLHPAAPTSCYRDGGEPNAGTAALQEENGLDKP